MNYVSVELIREASRIMAAIERFQQEHPEILSGLVCGRQPAPGTARCGRPAEYLVADYTWITEVGDIEEAPAWRCRQHLEQELGRQVEEQPVFRRSPGLPPGYPPGSTEEGV